VWPRMSRRGKLKTGTYGIVAAWELAGEFNKTEPVPVALQVSGGLARENIEQTFNKNFLTTRRRLHRSHQQKFTFRS
jgi:hypothetical protein